MPAGSLPDGELSETLSETAPPGAATPDDRARESDGGGAAMPDMKNAMKPVAHFNVREDILAKE
jgi:hypothetical protein